MKSHEAGGAEAGTLPRSLLSIRRRRDLRAVTRQPDTTPRVTRTNYEPLMVPGTSALAYWEPAPDHRRSTDIPNTKVVRRSGEEFKRRFGTYCRKRTPRQLTTRIEDTLAVRPSVGVLAGARVERHLRVSTPSQARNTPHTSRTTRVRPVSSLNIVQVQSMPLFRTRLR